MTKFRDMPATVIGRLGEQLTHRLLRDLGAGVIASFKFSGENDNEAPALEFHDKRVVLPDFDVSMRGRRFWVELKTYKEPQFNRAHRCQVHGIPTRLFEQYCMDERETGTDVFLGVLEVDSGALLISREPVSKIEPRYPCLCGCESNPDKCEYRTKWGSSYPQWYFRRDSFTEWHRLTGGALEKLQATHNKLSHAIRKHVHNEAPPRVEAKPPWSWACLPCNVVGTGDKAKHMCTDAQPWRRDYWTRRLRFALKTPSADQVTAIVAKPIERIQLVQWLGDSWAPSGDIA